MPRLSRSVGDVRSSPVRDILALTELNRPRGGMFVWARLPCGWDASALLDRALACGVAYVPGAPFFAASPDARTMRLAFVTNGVRQVGDGLARLAAALVGGPVEGA